MREMFSVCFLICLQVTSLLLTAVGSAFNSAGALVHVLFVTRATRHDNRFALKAEERQQPSVTNISHSTVMN